MSSRRKRFGRWLHGLFERPASEQGQPAGSAQNSGIKHQDAPSLNDGKSVTPASETEVELDRRTTGPQQSQAQLDVPVAKTQRTLVRLGGSGRSTAAESTSQGYTGEQPISVAGEAFRGAHNFVINNPVMNSTEGTQRDVLLWLSRFTMSGAEYNSSIRDPPPRCHPGTRLDILGRILDWFNNLDRDHQLLWIRGSAAIGKSAIMQTLAEEFAGSKKLGAALFFSRPNKRHDPSLVFPTLAYQLAVQLPQYRKYLGQKMMEDPRLLETGVEHQFRTLISDPFSSVTEAEVGSFAILLDGLDECQGDAAQIQIFKLISGFSYRYPHSPLVWCVASRPEAHLTFAFKSPSITCTFWTEDIPSDSNEACDQVERFLRARFAEIHEKYHDIIPAKSAWPSERDITEISAKSSGHFGFASTVAEFIDDPYVCNPISQLETVLSVTTSSGTSDPLAALHVLYTRILDVVPKGLLPPLKLLLSHVLLEENMAELFKSPSVPLVHSSTLFNLQQHTAYAALRKLHSVIKVPPSEEAGSRGIQFHHASFGDYLYDPSKSGEYAIDPVGYHIKRWLGYSRLTSKVSYQPNRLVQTVELAWDCVCDVYDNTKFWLTVAQNVLSPLPTHFLTDSLEPTRPPGLDPARLILTTSDLCKGFETIDFSHIGSSPYHMDSAQRTFGSFAHWLIHNTPQPLVHSKLVKAIDLTELDLARIQVDKISVLSRWSAGVKGILLGMLAQYSDLHFVNDHLTAPFYPMNKLTLKLEELRSSNVPVKAMVIGQGLRSCVCIFTEHPEGKKGLFYYVPYTS